MSNARNFIGRCLFPPVSIGRWLNLSSLRFAGTGRDNHRDHQSSQPDVGASRSWGMRGWTRLHPGWLKYSKVGFHGSCLGVLVVLDSVFIR
jgi:hypothetical protein